MIAGQRDPHTLAALARTRMKAKHDDRVEALDGMFDDHHGELAALLLDQITALDAKITQLTTRIAESATAIPQAWGTDRDGTTGPGAGTGPGAVILPAPARLAQIPGLSEDLARSIIAETGLDMTRFPTAAHLVSWAGLCPSARQSGPRTRAGKKGQGNGYLRGYLGRAAVAAAAPPPSSANGTHGSPAAAATPRPRSPSPVPSWSSSGTCSPTPPPATPTSAPATTPPAPAPTVSSATTSARSRPSGST